ncbi:MAG: hypothetical protein KKB65_02905 [Nanoarchaeota archaeon]|nr:hypothetical protein [Nanoarchaeota archaeon]MBU1030156.1 hypothetical protein [Nanoarchaeota archaeon]MBU1849401.1 hypothetical protein [Nanoarchaeota archaeon]
MNVIFSKIFDATLFVAGVFLMLFSENTITGAVTSTLKISNTTSIIGFFMILFSALLYISENHHET